MRKLAVVVLAATLALGGCNLFRDPPESGYVKKIKFYPEWTETIYGSICASYDKYGSCTVSVPTVSYVEHSPAWCLTLIDDKDKTHIDDVCVDPLTYSKYQPGDHYPDPR